MSGEAPDLICIDLHPIHGLDGQRLTEKEGDERRHAVLSVRSMGMEAVLSRTRSTCWKIQQCKELINCI